MKIKTSELVDNTLDWAVSKALHPERERLIYHFAPDKNDPMSGWEESEDYSSYFYISGPERMGPFKPSTNYAQGCPIMDKAKICTAPDPANGWEARGYMDAVRYYGPTRLVAAMRCYVASQLGDEVEIPEELL